MDATFFSNIKFATLIGTNFCGLQQPFRVSVTNLTKKQGKSAAAAKSLQSCPTLCNPIDGSPPGSTVPGILQAKILEWAAISSNAWKWKVKVKSLSRVQLLATPWTAAYMLLHPWDFPGKSTGVGCHCLLQGKPTLLLIDLDHSCWLERLLRPDTWLHTTAPPSSAQPLQKSAIWSYRKFQPRDAEKPGVLW